MVPEVQNAADDPGFFDGRFMVEIERWNWELYIGLGSLRVPKKYRFQGSLNHSRWLDLSGRVRGPARDRGKSVRVAISTFGPEVEFGGKKGLPNVGHFLRDPGEGPRADFSVSLMLPEADLSPAITCLGSGWKFLDIWIGEDADGADVTAFSFSRDIHPNLVDWAGPTFEAI